MLSDGVEADLFEAIMLAGACAAAAKARPGRRAYWLNLHRHYSGRVNVLLEWDSVSWCWPDVAKAGGHPGLSSFLDGRDR